MSILTVGIDYRRDVAEHTLDAMVDGFRKDTGNHLGTLTSTDLEEVAHTIHAVMESQPSGVETMAWVLALAVARLAGPKEGVGR